LVVLPNQNGGAPGAPTRVNKRCFLMRRACRFYGLDEPGIVRVNEGLGKISFAPKAA